GVTPSPSPVVLWVRTGTVAPSNTVVPEMFDWYASVCAIRLAYTGASRHATTMTKRTAAPASAVRVRTSWPNATRHGPAETAPGVLTAPRAGRRACRTAC